jgi:leucyl aminopeptidase
VSPIIEPTLGRDLRPRHGLLAVACLEDAPLPIDALDEATAKVIRKAVEARGWRGERDRQLRLTAADGEVAVTLYGLGPTASFAARRLATWIDATAGDARALGASELLVAPPRHPMLETAEGAAALLRHLALTGYHFDRFRPGARKNALRKVRVAATREDLRILRAARPRAVATARGVTLARDLANTPPNRATPAWMAAQARALARRVGGKVKVLGPKELRKMGMEALLAVGRGSANPPRLVRLEIGDRGPAVALVGKGITFDTGGISLKPGAGMDEMKFDKAGACTVLGIVEAVAELELRVRLRAYLPLAENMPGSRAYRPGDIVRTRNGKTVEVLNTDAEGRLVLADAIALAVEEKPDALVEYSTLTGATVVALGHHGAALYTPDDALAGELLRSAEEAGERLWRMPLWSEFREEMKGRHADLRNLAGRWGGGNTAAAFLAEFVGETEAWAHLDIAGTAWVPADQRGSFGATGYGVASTVGWLLARPTAG